MRKFLLLFSFVPVCAFAGIDFSSCEKIGYARINPMSVEDCQNTKIECDDSEPDCVLPDTSTPEGCQKFIDEMNKYEEDDRYLQKCAATDEFISHKTQDFSLGIYQGALLFSDGEEINIAALLQDNENIYILHRTIDGLDKYEYLEKYDGKFYIFNEFK